MQTDATVVDDLADPRLPVALRAVLAAGRPWASRARLDKARLLQAAVRRSGVDGASVGDVFAGAAHAEDGFDALVASFDEDAGLNAAGRAMVTQAMVQLLATRLRLATLLEQHPAVSGEPVTAPVVVMGLPRTGTTHLHFTLACDDRLRHLPYWESLEPIPRPDRWDDDEPPALDRRIASCAASLRILDWAMPRFSAMHELTTHGPHEEIQFLAVDFSSMYFEAGWDVPGYGRWYAAHDHTRAYATMRSLLQAAQWLRGGRRWLLKSPQHLEQLPALLATFPDATVVQTHRDPVAVLASLTTMLAYARRMQHERVDPVAVGRAWTERIEQMLHRNVEQRAALPADRVIDVRFHDLVADQPGTIGSILEAAGLPFDERAALAVRRHLEANPRGKHGRLRYRLDDLGLREDELRERFAFYTDAYGVRADPSPG
jgi:hypothetical protein